MFSYNPCLRTCIDPYRLSYSIDLGILRGSRLYKRGYSELKGEEEIIESSLSLFRSS